MLLSVCRTVTVNRPHSGPAAVTVNLTSGDLAAVLQGTLSPLQVMEQYSIVLVPCKVNGRCDVGSFIRLSNAVIGENLGFELKDVSVSNVLT